MVQTTGGFMDILNQELDTRKEPVSSPKVDMSSKRDAIFDKIRERKQSESMAKITSKELEMQGVPQKSLADKILGGLGKFTGAEAVGQFAGNVLKEGADIVGDVYKGVKTGDWEGAGDSTIEDPSTELLKGVGGATKLTSFVAPAGTAIKGGSALVNTGRILGGGALAGGLYGGGEALEEGEDMGDVAKQAGIGAGAGAATAGVFSLAGKAFGGLRKALAGVDEQTINTINPKFFDSKVAQDVSEYAGAQTKRADKLGAYLKQAAKASKNVKEDTPLALAAKNFVKAKGSVDDLVSQAGKKVGDAKKALGTKVKLSSDVVDNLVTQFNDDIAELGVKFDNKGELVALAGREALEGADASTLVKINQKIQSLKKDPNAARALDIRDFIGDEIGKVSLKEGSTRLQRISTRTRGSIKNGVAMLSDDLASANARFSELKDLQKELIDALGKDGKRAEGWLKQVLSGRGRLPKELAEKLQKEVGEDLVEDAVFSRFAIEALGDAKQKTLFDQAFDKNRGIIEMLKDFAIEGARRTVAKPEKIATEIATDIGQKTIGENIGRKVGGIGAASIVDTAMD